ncbi:hypothetical protein ACI8AC_24165 [Geodermatophilus sp. SYSU D00758]
MPELRPTPTYFQLAKPTVTHPDGRRSWRLTDDVRVTVYPSGRIEFIDSAGRPFEVRTWHNRRGTQIELVPRPDIA